MSELFYVVSTTVNVFLEAFQWILLVRVLLPFFSDTEESPVYAFCCAVTEPVVGPVRSLLDRVPALEGSPVDFSYVVTCLIVILVRIALPTA